MRGGGNVSLTQALVGGVDVGELIADWSDRLRAKGAGIVSPALADTVSRSVTRYAAPALSARHYAPRSCRGTGSGGSKEADPWRSHR